MQLHIPTFINELKYRNAMNVEDILNYSGENDMSFELLTDEQIFESVIKTHKKDEVEENRMKLK